MKNTKEIFRENLRKIIQTRGVTLTEAAADCDISLSFLNQLLSGKKSYSPDTLDKLSKGLQCTQADLFADISRKAPVKPEPLEKTNSEVLILNRLTSIETKIDKKSGPSLDPKKQELFNLISSLSSTEVDIFTRMIKRRLGRKINNLREP
jgi:transcriptional regulator with XRE-family HTH domain